VLATYVTEGPVEQVWYFISKTSRAFDALIHSRALLTAILCWLATLCIMSSCSLLAFPLSVSLALSRLCCLCFSVSIWNS